MPGSAQADLRLIPFSYFSQWKFLVRAEQSARKGRCPLRSPLLFSWDRTSQEWKSYMHLLSQEEQIPCSFASCLGKKKLSSFSPSIPILRGALQLKALMAFCTQGGGVEWGVGKSPVYHNRWFKCGDYKILKLKQFNYKVNTASNLC